MNNKKKQNEIMKWITERKSGGDKRIEIYWFITEVLIGKSPLARMCEVDDVSSDFKSLSWPSMRLMEFFLHCF